MRVIGLKIFFLSKDPLVYKPSRFTALLCKSLIINGAGEGNRTLVEIHRRLTKGKRGESRWANSLMTALLRSRIPSTDRVIPGVMAKLVVTILRMDCLLRRMLFVDPGSTAHGSGGPSLIR